MRILITSLFVLLSISVAQTSYASDGLLNAQDVMAEIKNSVPKISTEDLKSLVDSGEDFVLLDVRMPSEIESMGSIQAEQDIAVARGWLEVQIWNHVIDYDTRIIPYCGGGIRSAFATKTLGELGFTNVQNYESGLFGWQKAGHPVTQ
ncbi:MAG: rhodanese-related sulfurtransferase [Parasphingorhabdus sp.]|jgi:rhodanese-related sulfurtransferase